MFKVEDKVELFGFSGTHGHLNGRISSITRIDAQTNAAMLADSNYVYFTNLKLYKPKGVINMFGTIGSDLKVFIKDHKSSIYMVAMLLLADHLIFEGAFRTRLQSIMSNLLAKVEKAVGGSGPDVAQGVSLVADKKA